MSTSAAKEASDAAELRQRVPHGASAAISGNRAEDHVEEPAETRDPGHGVAHPEDGADGVPLTGEKAKKTYGRTPDGTGRLTSHSYTVPRPSVKAYI